MHCNCGERLWLVEPLDLAFDFDIGSLEARYLIGWAIAHPGASVWSCYDCGSWIPAA